jgi:DNA-nicking Smr family endonuclease
VIIQLDEWRAASNPGAGNNKERGVSSDTWWERLRDTLREFLGVTPTLDLHGLGVREAVAETARFLRHAQAHDARVVRIVYGKGHGSPGGKGVLRDVIPRWLEREGTELVERYERLPDASGADGSVRVWVRKRIS